MKSKNIENFDETQSNGFFLWLFIFHFAGMGHRKTLSPRQDRTRGIPALHPTAQRQDPWKARLYIPASCVTHFLRTSRIGTVEFKVPVW